jgi:crotonobetainyl-CoA:carnitine CoA-transferase CaiB-like acyl-CoA transferase
VSAEQSGTSHLGGKRKSPWPEPTPFGAAPLAGMRVVDLSQQLPGPYASLLLASLGACVIKIEPPGGDAARHLDPEMFANVNAGKSSQTLDLKDLTAREQLYELIAEADVFIEGFRPGVTKRLGCDYETVKRLRPNMVYCSISGFGQKGPFATKPTHDLSLQAMVGALADNAVVDRIGVPWVDLATGTSAAFAITATWHQGGGGYLDMSMLDSAVAWSRVKPAAVHDVEPTYGTFTTSDNKQIVLALLEDSMWERLCTALQWNDWSSNPDYSSYLDRRRRAEIIRERLKPSLLALSQQDVLDLAGQFDLPLGLVHSELDEETRAQLESRIPAASPEWRSCVPLPQSVVQPLNPAPLLR